ncbi:MAG: hypothetical protein GC161_07875 [Planctomycetaceae bacterium]|nr:hypothetical protein [Planctomycetaceae bacterium]
MSSPRQTAGRPLPGLLHAALDGLADAVAPRRCHLCGAPAPDGLACREHRFWGDSLLRAPRDAGPHGLRGPHCGRCLRALAPVLPDGAPCAYCRERAPPLAGGLALGSWRGDGCALAPWILALKYGGRRDLARFLGAALGARLLALRAHEHGGGAHPPVVLVPVPLHPLRRWERGYDQAALLAAEAARVARQPWLPALARSRSTRPQGSAFAADRRREVRGAFVPRAPRLWQGVPVGTAMLGRPHGVGGSEVWLVDDVVSSASTASEAASVLTAMGALRVRLLVVARGGAVPGGSVALDP